MILGVHWKDWCWSWNSITLATWCEELTYLKRPWCWERLGAGEEGDDRGWDGWMASSTQWTWVWINSRSWWWTGKPGVLRFMGSQRVIHNWATELHWTEMNMQRKQESHCGVRGPRYGARQWHGRDKIRAPLESCRSQDISSSQQERRGTQRLTSVNEHLFTKHLSRECTCRPGQLPSRSPFEKKECRIKTANTAKQLLNTQISWANE